MSLPFLTEEDILPTYLDLELSLSGLTDNELQLVSTFKKYISKNWMNGSENLSVFYYEFSTNNGAESYHKSLNGYIKTNHPNIWKFLSSLNNIMNDYDLEQRRLENGLEISRPPELKNRLKKALRNEYKTKYLNGTYTALELVNCISQTIGRENKTVLSSCDSLSFQEEIDSPSDEESNKSRCNVCLQDRIRGGLTKGYGGARAPGPQAFRGPHSRYETKNYPKYRGNFCLSEIIFI